MEEDEEEDEEEREDGDVVVAVEEVEAPDASGVAGTEPAASTDEDLLVTAAFHDPIGVLNRVLLHRRSSHRRRSYIRLH